MNTAFTAAWRRRTAAFLLGLLSVFALPPHHLWILLVPALAGLLWLLDFERKGLGALWLGWLFGFGHFLGGLSWLIHPFLVDAARHAWIAPFALSGLAAYMAVFPAFALWLTWRSRAQGVALILVFAAAWSLGELLRGWLFTGFPWNLVATVWNATPAMMQAASVIGALGLGLVTVLAAAMPVVAFRRDRAWMPAILATAAGLAAIWGAGAWRLSTPLVAAQDAPRILVVQPNIDQREKWKPENRRMIFDHLLAMSQRDEEPTPRMVIWPEAATPFFLDESPGALAIIGQSLGPADVLLTGSPRRDMDSQGRSRYWNSVLAINADADIVGRYDKAHLVPFGEYVPLEAILPLEKMVAGMGNFSAGTPGGLIHLDGLPAMAPLICYEALFGAEIHFGATRPAWLLNVTNDAWFGPGAGPRQHLAAARLRAVEQGLPMVRAANTGISAVIDARGGLVMALDLGQAGTLAGRLPPALPETPYARFGSTIPLLMITLTLILAVIIRRRLGAQSHHGQSTA